MRNRPPRPREKMPISIRGLLRDPDDLYPAVFHNADGGLRYLPDEVYGPAPVRDRQVRVFLTQADLADLLGHAITAAEASNDDELLAAYKKVTAYLRRQAQ